MTNSAYKANDNYAGIGKESSKESGLPDQPRAKISRQGAVYANDILAGYLTEWIESKKVFYSFQYTPEYLKTGVPIGQRFALQEAAFIDEKFPPFFENLLCEGWCKAHQVDNSNLDSRDEFGLLLENGGYLIGAISVKRVENDFVQPSDIVNFP